MKCPKCHYLGYETGDRCKNCGYDFSLLTTASGETRLADAPLRPESRELAGALDDRLALSWSDIDLDLHAPPLSPSPEPLTQAREATGPSPDEPLNLSLHEEGLPLFTAGSAEDQEPLVRVPPAPRKPVAVRRTPEIPRSRPAARVERASEGEPKLQFLDHALLAEPVVPPALPRAPLVVPSRSTSETPSAAGIDPCKPRPRVIAAVIDLGLLAAIDLLVVYLTLHVATLTLADWRRLPLVPLLIFLTLVKVGYFSAFAAIGGQTIGKMAARVRVVTDSGDFLTPGRAIQRSLAAMIALLTLGLAFAPALTGRRRALHDVVSGTCVVPLPVLSGSHPLAGDVASMAASPGDAM